jgi:hypothetical protein
MRKINEFIIVTKRCNMRKINERVERRESNKIVNGKIEKVTLIFH